MRIITLPFLFLALNLYAQKPAIKFGKVTKEELQLTECSFHPEANSMILGEYGELRFNYDNDKGWQYRLYVVRRIKVFNKLDKDIANISLRVYDPVDGNKKEEIGHIKAFTYNLIAGKIEKSKLSNSEEYKTRISDYRVETSFAMPDVREGSVIEYEYSMTSDYISNLSTWHFQNDLPTAVSEFRYTIPEFFNYTESQVGTYVSLERNEGQARESYTYKWEYTGVGGNVERGTSSINSISRKIRVVGRNIPPVLDEPFMNNRPNIPARLEFQLMSIKMPSQPIKYIAGNYEKFNKNILDWSSFGGVLNKGNFARDKIGTLSADPDEQALQIYNWIQNHFSFNDRYGVTSQKAGKQAFKDANGSVADINLTLVAAYREAGLDANPVILSTRGHGIPHPIYPSYENFNYVIAAVNTSKGLFLTDATTGLPFGMLPPRCLNGKGWMVSEDGGAWMDLKNNANHSTLVYTEISFDEDEMKSAFEVRMDGYAGLEAVNEYKKGEKDYQEKIASSFPELEIEKFTCELSPELKKELKLNFEGSKFFDGEDIIYIQPILYGGMIDNPFKREERFSPVDFPYSFDKQVIVKIQIPDGYSAKLPEPAMIALPNNNGRFIYSVSQIGNSINLTSIFKLARVDFTPQEYPQLKQFYQLVSDKNNEMIVLKKE